jgi:hypothetical protein
VSAGREWLAARRGALAERDFRLFFGGYVVSLVAAALGTRAALLAGAAWVLITCATVLSAPSVRRFTVPPEPGRPHPSG